MSETIRKKKHSELGTFVVRVQQHQHNTFQGEITWIEEDKTSHFRSMWEMIKLMEDGLFSCGEIEKEKLPDWK